jgi:DNA-binding LacI/PurR family transcriptional regulator
MNPSAILFLQPSQQTTTEFDDRKGESLYIYPRDAFIIWGHDCVITIRDIAKATGLSTATVSMVLNQAGRRIPPVTQRLVQKTALKLGYFPNLQARSLRSNRTHSRVPDDCSVVGFDDIPGAAFYNPPLTTICQHLEEQGLMSAEIMQRQLSSHSAGCRNKTQKQIEPNLIVRKSTARVSLQARWPWRSFLDRQKICN